MKKIISLVIIATFLICCEKSSQTEKTQQSVVKNSEVFATTDQSVGNITFTPKGDLVYSLHPFFSPENRVMIMDAKTKKSKPFPNKEWNTPKETNDQFLSSVLGIRNDENGIIWIIDMALRNPIKPKIVGWNTNTNQLEKIYYIDQSSVPTSQPNDMVVDTKHKAFIIADEGIGNGGNGSTAAFIIVDMETSKTRRVLEGHKTTLPENKPIVVDGKTLSVNGTPVLVGNDGITTDKDFEWIYYGPLNGTKIYRVKTVDLLNESLTTQELEKRIETYSEKPNNGGFSIDIEGNLYLTAIESKSASVVLAKDKSIHIISENENMVWPDGVSYNHVDKYMYISASQVNRGAVFNDGKDKTTKPFYIFRFKPVVDGVPFR